VHTFSIGKYIYASFWFTSNFFFVKHADLAISVGEGYHLCCLMLYQFAVVDGHIKRPQDEDIQSNVLEIIGTNVQSTYITCPADPSATLGIKLPFLAIIVKNLKMYFTFEIQVLDDKNVRRRFQASNFQVCKILFSADVNYENCLPSLMQSHH
jgi:hypothetical protein